jgi:hypothetical protein
MDLIKDFDGIDPYLFNIMMACLFKEKETLKNELFMFLKKVSGEENAIIAESFEII